MDGVEAGTKPRINGACEFENQLSAMIDILSGSILEWEERCLV